VARQAVGGGIRGAFRRLLLGVASALTQAVIRECENTMKSRSESPLIQLSHGHVAHAARDAWRSHRAVRLLISVGQAYHEGDKLASIIDWVNRHRHDPFDVCQIAARSGEALTPHGLVTLERVQLRIKRRRTAAPNAVAA
jgi:hypothetical protein